mmetsp:Transcript_1802/g.3871  ORF Transcript_1802/g.3871 Transcript_1802/m.3871 type:complete len:232 (-) Transcript_1802:94-789(-)|eukprot:CAMPEP_0172297830 /NCGR_PEP_ID=MMETSP1058-20130122/712_1 /TAXON_ID=83371 /ORGANISM="Detonula confervacea, Strain CCMP 353" /LENGTH=231 /DNA_ID=CAMNT_0013007027 /DNA_START=166 /DNA_END=861 /DNA_ORIENTATION=+
MSINSETPKHNEQPRVYVTSLKSITASSPTKTNWSSRPPAGITQSRACRALRRLLWPRRDDYHTDNEPIISDSISDSKHLQNSIMLLTENMEEHEVHCCKQDAANEVIHALQKKAAVQIDEGKLHDALHNLNNSLSLQQKLYGKNHPKVATTLNIMGEVLSNMGEDFRFMAMSALEESLAIRQELEPGSEDTADTLKNLWLLFHQSKVAISSVEKEGSTTVQDAEASTQVQ